MIYDFIFTKGAIALSAVLMASAAATPAFAQYKMATPMPEGITTPDEVHTSLGELNFDDGMPDAGTIEKVYHNLDLMRGVDAYIRALPGVAMLQTKKSFAEAGVGNGSIALFDGFMSSKHRFLNGNSETIYGLTWLDLSKGPLVIDLPPNVLGGINDLWQRWVADIGIAGQDQGKGGKYLIVPAGFSGNIPEGYTVIQAPGYQNLFFIRGLLTGTTQKAAIANIKNLKIYPLQDAGQPAGTRFKSMTDVPIDVIFRGDKVLFSDLNEIIQSEPLNFLAPETLGVFATLGIRKGKAFAPDARMATILEEAAAIGNATARTISFRPRDEQVYLKPDASSWFLIFGGNDYRFIRDGYVSVDARTLFHYSYTGTSPAMANKMVGVGSQYASNVLDSNGRYLDGSRNYRMRMPANAPVKDFWSLIVFDPQTRSMLQTDQTFPTVSSQKKGVARNADGSVDIYFGPKPAKGHEGNWIQTVPGKAWFATLRMYGPLEPWFERTWLPGEIVPLGE